VTHYAFHLNRLAAGASVALGISANLSRFQELPTSIVELLLAEVGLIVVLQAHVTFELRRQRDAAQPIRCQLIVLGQKCLRTYLATSSGLYA
jgi:hypothetical protein